MKNKILAFLLMLAVAGFMIGFDYDQAHADARAGVGPADWAHAGAYAHAFVSHGGVNCVNRDDGQTPPHRHAFCTSTNGGGSWGNVEANTWSINGWILEERVEGRVQPGDCFFFGEPGTKFLGEGFVLDTIRLEVDTSIAGKLIRRVTGLIKLYPSRWSASLMVFNLMAGNLDQSIMCFHNQGTFNGSALQMENFGTTPISPTTTTLGDTLVVTINQTDTITCSIPRNQLSVLLEKIGFMNNVPTLTQWGVIVLAGLIVASAVFIMLKRRRAAVLA